MMARGRGWVKRIVRMSELGEGGRGGCRKRFRLKVNLNE